MTACSRNKILVDLFENKKKQEAAHKEYNVAGCVHPLRPQMTAKGQVPPGSTVEFAIEEACKSAGVRKVFMKRGVAQVGKRDFEKGITTWHPVPQKDWKTRKLGDGELLRFRLLPRGGGGGGGGKSPLRTILTIVVAVAAIAAMVMIPALPVFEGAAWFGMTAAQTSSFIGGLAGLAVSTIGMVLVNAIAPIKPGGASAKALSGSSSESQVYSASSGQNRINQWGRVPVPLGRGRFAPPKAASPYTQTVGEDQYLHELLCLGIGDISWSQFKIGTTAIEEFPDCQYEIFKYDPKYGYTSSLYPTGIFQEDLSIQLKQGVRNVRTTAECDSFEIDFSFQGLCYINDDNSKAPRSVDFTLQYRPKGSTSWTSIATRQYSSSKYFSIAASLIPSGSRYAIVVANPTDGIRLLWDTPVAPNGNVQLGVVRANKKIVTWTEYLSDGEYAYPVEKSKYACDLVLEDGAKTSDEYEVDGFAISLANGSDSTEASISVSGGYLTSKNSPEGSGTRYVTVSGAQTRLLRHTYTVKPPYRGEYEVAVTRSTEDSTDDRLINASYWGALRSVTNDVPVSTKYPVNLMAIKIRASGQLSGAISTLTGYYETKCWDWDKSSQMWIWRYTSNPASLFRYVLEDKYSHSRPQSESMLDLQSIREAHEYWEPKGWKYNFVCDADASVFSRLQSICAAGLASPTMVDGKWAIVVDKPRENISCAFTSSNSWGWSFKRSQARLPNAVHCTFQNEDTWDSDIRVVPTDEEPQDQYVYETQDYEGVTSAAQVYQLARFHYADAKMRRRTISFKCYDEAILCTRGDLVDCSAPTISPYGLQVGRLRKVERDEDGNVVALYTDQLNTTDFSGRRFGVKVYTQSGAVLHAEVKPENKSQRKLTLLYPQQMEVVGGSQETSGETHPGDKYAFGDYTEETFPAIVLGMKFNSDWTCDVTLQDYIPYIYGDLSKPIPDWTSTITTPITSKWVLGSTPILQSVVADESALVQTATGVQPRILVAYRNPIAFDDRVALTEFEISEAGANKWVTQGRVPIEQTSFYYTDISEKKYYDIRVRYVGKNGEVGPYVFQRNVYVVGRTSPPPQPSAVYLNGTTLIIQQANRPLDLVGHKVFMSADEDDDFSVAVELTNPYTVNGTFELSPWRGRARAIFVTSVDELGLQSKPVRLVIDLGDVSTRNILFEYSEKERNWGGVINGGFIESRTLFSDEVIGLYPQDDLSSYRSDNDDVAYYIKGNSATLSYMWEVDIPRKYKDARVLIFPEMDSGSISKTLFRHLTDTNMYPQDDDSPRNNQDDTSFLYAQYTVGEWEAMPVEYYTPGDEILQFQIVFGNEDAATVTDIKTVLDVEDKKRDYEDLVISQSGITRVPVPPSYFRAITTVRTQLQYVEGSTAVKTEFVKGSETLDSDGFIVLGPYIYASDAAAAFTSANCDLTVYGY